MPKPTRKPSRPAPTPTDKDTGGKLYRVRDKDWAAVWGENLTHAEAHKLKEHVVAHRKSRTARIESMDVQQPGGAYADIRVEVEQRGWGWENGPLTPPEESEIAAAEDRVVAVTEQARSAPCSLAFESMANFMPVERYGSGVDDAFVQLPPDIEAVLDAEEAKLAARPDDGALDDLVDELSAQSDLRVNASNDDISNIEQVSMVTRAGDAASDFDRVSAEPALALALEMPDAADGPPTVGVLIPRRQPETKRSRASRKRS